MSGVVVEPMSSSGHERIATSLVEFARAQSLYFLPTIRVNIRISKAHIFAGRTSRCTLLEVPNEHATQDDSRRKVPAVIVNCGRGMGYAIGPDV